MRTKPLSLSDQQLAMVRAGAASVPQAEREGYLRFVADELQHAPEVTDEVAREAVQLAKFRWGVG